MSVRGYCILAIVAAAISWADESSADEPSRAPPLLTPAVSTVTAPSRARQEPRVLELPPLPAASTAPVESSEPADAFAPSAEFQEWISKIVREQLPHEYEKKKNWGQQTKAFGGLSVWVEEGRLETRRKFKEVNDGSWQMYRVTLSDPAEKFDVKIANIRQLPSGKVGIDVSVIASLAVFGRQSLWERGVQLFSISAEADARVRLWAQAEVATRMDFARFPPDIILGPEITAAKFEIPDFRLRRIGQANGPVVRSLSHATREALEEKLADDNAKLVAKLNRAIAKQEKKLKLSLADVMSSKFSSLLPADAEQKSQPQASTPPQP